MEGKDFDLLCSALLTLYYLVSARRSTIDLFTKVFVVFRWAEEQ